MFQRTIDTMGLCRSYLLFKMVSLFNLIHLVKRERKEETGPSCLVEELACEIMKAKNSKIYNWQVGDRGETMV